MDLYLKMNVPEGNSVVAADKVSWARVIVAVAAGLGMFLAMMDIAVNVALPSMAEDLDADLQTVQWVIVVFVATRAGLVMCAGSFGDYFGLRPVYLWGAGAYLVAMFCIAFSPDLSSVVGFRVLQGIGTGCLYAVSPAIAASVFPSDRRGLGMGFTAGSQALGMIAGSFGAGLLVAWSGWEWVFLGRVPFVALALVLAYMFMNRGNPNRATGLSFVIVGAVALVAGLICLVIGLRLGRSVGWDSVPVLALLPLASLLVVAFWRIERFAPWPVLPLHLLRVNGFIASTVSMFLVHFGVFGIWFIFPFYVVDSLGQGPVVLGALLATMAFLYSGFSGAGGWLNDRIGSTPVGVGGLMVMVAGLAYMAFLDAGSPVGQVAFRIAIVGGGLGLFQASAYALMMRSVPQERFGTAGAALSLAQAFGSVLAVVVLGGIFAWRGDHHMAEAVGLVNAEGIAFVNSFREVFLVGATVGLMGAAALLLGGQISRKVK